MTRRIPTDERGFALMGVVMFVLVLTILALSLFSLSSFEGQFMKDAMDRSGAYNAALGGLERARFALASTGRLSSVKDGLPLDSTVYAVARQNADTSDAVHWQGALATDVLIRVKARYGSKVRFLESRYSAGLAQSLYRNLMTLSDNDSGLYVYRQDFRDPVTPPEYSWKATYLSGDVRQNAPNIPDVIFPLANTGPTVLVGGALEPTVGPFIAQHALGPGTTVVPKQPGFNPYVLNALTSPDSIAFFHTPGPDGDWSLDLSDPQHSSNEPPYRISVLGTVLWMFDQGLRVDRTLRVTGSGHANDMLIVVAGRQDTDPDDPAAGIALLGSIDSPDVPVILVSDGNVLVEHRDFGGDCSSDNNSSTVNCLSIFGRSAWIMGPDANYDYVTGPKLVFSHPANHPANALVDRLAAMGYLPNTQGAVKGRLSPVAGTWREVNEDNPVFP